MNKQLIYSKDELYVIYKSDKFIEAYKQYVDYFKLSDFLNNIDINENYYKLKLKSNINQSEKDINLHNILDFLNKITSDNYIQITNKILDIITDNIVDIYVYHVLEKIILHENYSNEYKYIISKLNDQYNINSIINTNINLILNNINCNKISNSDYETLCNKNKLMDNLVGYYRMIIQINELGLYNGDIHIIINDIIENIKQINDEEQYKFIQCLYSIVKTDNKLYDCIDKDLTKYLTSKKNKFLLMDIHDLKQ